VTGAGTGSVLILRWYWWRINAWSEVSSMAAAFVVSVVLQTAFHLNSDDPVQFAHLILITVAITTVVWVAATFLTSPETDATLLGFYRRVRPSAGWGPVARLAPEVKVSRDLGWNLVDWVCGCVLIYGALFGIGKMILKDFTTGAVYLLVAVLAAVIISWDLNRRGWASVME
jgi:solute:Na+ symporter, SSS family